MKRHDTTTPSVRETKEIMLSIVVPVYNSAQLLPELYERLVTAIEALEESFEVIFVEDCGADNAWKVAVDIAKRDPRVTAIQLMRNSGQGIATLCGLAHTRGQIVVTLDDDLQHPPEEVPLLIEALLADEELDVVLGVSRERHHSLFRRAGSALIDWLAKCLVEKDPRLRLTSFRAMRRIVIDALLTMRVPYPAIGPMLVSTTGRMANVEVRHAPRRVGRSGYTLSKIAQGTLSFLIGYSMLPLRMLAGFGAIGTSVCMGLGVFYLVRFFVRGSAVPGWTSLMLVLISLFGVLLLGLAILGEYLLRIFRLESTTEQYLIRHRVGVHTEPPQERNQGDVSDFQTRR